MLWYVLAHLITSLVGLFITVRQHDSDKELQILVLRHQVRLLQRQRPAYPDSRAARS